MNQVNPVSVLRYSWLIMTISATNGSSGRMDFALPCLYFMGNPRKVLVARETVRRWSTRREMLTMELIC